MPWAELRALRRLLRDYPATPYVFVSERRGPMTASNVRGVIARAGVQAQLPFSGHPHMLRHACGTSSPMTGTIRGRFSNTSAIATLTHTVRYTELSTRSIQRVLARLGCRATGAWSCCRSG